MKLAYISDQRFFLAPNGDWYTTASFPLDKMTETLLGLEQWVFYGRLSRIDDPGRLFKIPSCDKEIEYLGSWEAKSGALGFLASIPKQVAILRHLVRTTDVLWLKLPFLASLLCWLCCDLSGKITIAQMVGHPSALTQVYGKKWSFVADFMGLLIKRMYKRIHLPVFVSQWLASEFGSGLHEVFILNESRIDESHITIKDDVADNKRIVFIGRLSPEKGIELLIKSFAAIASIQPELTLELIGDGPLYSKLRVMTDVAGIRDRVIFSGYVPWDKVFLQLSKSCMMVLPSYSEGLGLVLLEAMSQSVPVIASRVGGIPEIVEDGQNGLLFEAGDEQGLTKCLQRMLQDDTLRQRIIVSGRETARKNTFQLQTGKILDYINNISK